MDKLFVYGIFLSEATRARFGMVNPEYATVKDYATYGGYIVEAAHAPGYGLCLTGLLVDMPKHLYDHRGRLVDNWKELDRLESGYKRIKITTTDGDEAYMYVDRWSEEEEDDADARSGQSDSNTKTRAV